MIILGNNNNNNNNTTIKISTTIVQTIHNGSYSVKKTKQIIIKLIHWPSVSMKFCRINIELPAAPGTAIEVPNSRNKNNNNKIQIQ